MGFKREDIACSLFKISYESYEIVTFPLLILEICTIMKKISFINEEFENKYEIELF